MAWSYRQGQAPAVRRCGLRRAVHYAPVEPLNEIIEARQADPVVVGTHRVCPGRRVPLEHLGVIRDRGAVLRAGTSLPSELPVGAGVGHTRIVSSKPPALAKG